MVNMQEDAKSLQDLQHKLEQKLEEGTIDKLLVDIIRLLKKKKRRI